MIVHCVLIALGATYLCYQGDRITCIGHPGLGQEMKVPLCSQVYKGRRIRCEPTKQICSVAESFGS